MVSEAVSSGKKTIVFPLEDRLDNRHANKYELFVDRLNEQGYVAASSSQKLGQTIYNVMRNKIYTKTVDDRRVLETALQKII
jgi:hypothetical protein